MQQATLDLVGEHHCFDGMQRFYRHASPTIGLPMRFSVYLPPAAIQGQACPAVFFLAGLTCTEETFMIKAGAQRTAAREGLILITPDTSPRGANLPGDTADWDFGVGAGFYLDATQSPWSRHYRMYSYIVSELHDLVCASLPVQQHRIGIMGHSMGGHGALVLALRNRDRFRSVSAFAPIAAPSHCPWGQKALGGYLGEDRNTWGDYDATALMSRQTQAVFPEGILIDQGLSDQFLADQLQPYRFKAACEAAGQPLTLREHQRYDHGYYFISTFIEDHLMHHARILNSAN